MKNKKINYRHGDVIIVPTKEPIKGDKQKAPVLAYGEVTGHSHQFTEGAVEIFKYNEKTYLIRVHPESKSARQAVIDFNGGIDPDTFVMEH